MFFSISPFHLFLTTLILVLDRYWVSKKILQKKSGSNFFFPTPNHLSERKPWKIREKWISRSIPEGPSRTGQNGYRVSFFRFFFVAPKCSGTSKNVPKPFLARFGAGKRSKNRFSWTSIFPGIGWIFQIFPRRCCSNDFPLFLSTKNTKEKKKKRFFFSTP